MKKIIVYDNAPIIHHAIQECFLEFSNDIVIESIYDYSSLINALRSKNVDLVVLEIKMPDHLGIEIIDTIKKTSSHTEVIIFSNIVNELLKQKAKENGALAVFSKRQHIAALVKRIHNLFEKNDDAKVTGKKATSIQVPYGKKKSMLTTTERLIIHWLMLGLTSQEIADVYGGKTNTVNNQKNLLLKKFNCKNSTQLIVHLMQLGYIGIDTE